MQKRSRTVYRTYHPQGLNVGSMFELPLSGRRTRFFISITSKSVFGDDLVRVHGPNPYTAPMDPEFLEGRSRLDLAAESHRFPGSFSCLMVWHNFRFKA